MGRFACGHQNPSIGKGAMIYQRRVNKDVRRRKKGAVIMPVWGFYYVETVPV